VLPTLVPREKTTTPRKRERREKSA